MKKFITISALIFPLYVFAQFINTGGPTQTSIVCKTIWAKGDTIFMGANENLYRTFNGGSNWAILTNGIPVNSDPRTIEYANGILMVGTNDNARIYSSSDWGDSFTANSTGVSGIPVPTASTSGNNSIFMGGTTFEPYRYDFNNNDWVATTGNGGITHGLTQTGNDTVWQCTGGITSGATQYSFDNGVNWMGVTNEPITDIGGGVMLASIAQDFMMVGNRVFVATNLSGFPYLYSDDLGVTWINTGITGYNWSDYGKKFIKINDNHLLAVASDGIWKSTDKGSTWTLTANNYGAAYSIVKGKGNHILIAYANGLLEFDNFGEGSLIKKHGIPVSASNLVLGPNNNIWVTSSGGVFQYSKAPGSWTLINDEYTDFATNKLSASYINFIGDTLYACGDGLYTSNDDGVTFSKRQSVEFSYQSPSVIREFGNKIILATRKVWTGGGTPHDPKIWVSTDGSTSFTEATFTNSISWGYGAGSENYIQEIHQTPTGFIADMNAGYALSMDGFTWTYYGDSWLETYVAAKGTEMYMYSKDGIMNSKSLEFSSDNGLSWNNLPLTGLPNGNFYGVFETSGIIYTYCALEAPYGLYQLNASNSSWSFVPDTEGPLTETITGVYFLNGELFANFQNTGTWVSGASINSVNNISNFSPLHMYPNPSNGNFSMDWGDSSLDAILEIWNVQGKLVYTQNIQSKTAIQTNLSSGFYVVKVKTKSETFLNQITIQ